MSAERAAEAGSPGADGPKITLEDVKRRAEAVRDLAASEAKRAANELMHEKVTQTLIAGVAFVAVLGALAFAVGRRNGRRGCPPALPPCCPPR